MRLPTAPSRPAALGCDVSRTWRGPWGDKTRSKGISVPMMLARDESHERWRKKGFGGTLCLSPRACRNGGEPIKCMGDGREHDHLTKTDDHRGNAGPSRRWD